MTGFMDGRQKTELPSMKMHPIMDGRHKTELPSMKTPKFMDGRDHIKTSPENLL